MTAVDQLQPILNDLNESVRKCTLDSAFSADKISVWLKKLNSMGAAEQLDEASARQMLFEILQHHLLPEIF